MKTLLCRIKEMKWAALLILSTALVIGGVSCRKESAGKPADVDYYTCSMHPSVKKQHPKDKCPICSMDLEPVKKKGVDAQAIHSGHAGHTTGVTTQASATAEDKPSEFTVPVLRLQQIGVTYATIEKRPFQHAMRAVGVVAYDKQRHWDYVARIEGYVQQLFVFSRGELVEKDAPILTIYSPDLLTTQNEFVDVIKMRDEAKQKGNKPVLESTERLYESTKQRLRLWNISDKEVAELEKSQAAGTRDALLAVSRCCARPRRGPRPPRDDGRASGGHRRSLGCVGVGAILSGRASHAEKRVADDNHHVFVSRRKVQREDFCDRPVHQRHPAHRPCPHRRGKSRPEAPA
jgi:hypothetical protein